MAKWMEVMNQFNRMCWHYQRKCECPMGCPMNGVNISQCRRIAFEQPEVTEKTVMDWAEENPEMVYPTWSEWLYEQGVLGDKVICNVPSMTAHNVATEKVDEPIPDDIAQKLGISQKPKEG